jgi:TRAP transporter TAXI family solute receptor
MMAKIKAGLLSLRDLFATAWWIILIVGIGFVVAYQFVQPAPPSRIVITTGSDSGAYYQFANRYAAILARNGVTLEVKTSAGSLENLARLKSDEAQVGFVQGGVVEPKADQDEEDNSGLLSLGSMFYEPVWVFYRGDKRLERLTDLRGKRVAIGQEGSGVRQLAQQLLEANEIPTGDHLVPAFRLEGGGRVAAGTDRRGLRDCR